jgi:NADPH-dependent ferric siderophore reductase
MEIRLSTPQPDFANLLTRAAHLAGCRAHIKRTTPHGVRFTLHEQLSHEFATDGQHDDVIARLFMADPGATVRTARAIYEGAASFHNRKGIEK